MHCENCGTKMTVINGESGTCNYCFCCGNAQKLPLETKTTLSGVTTEHSLIFNF
jgi:hypothetical protein